jgi:hypothetical protein
MLWEKVKRAGARVSAGRLPIRLFCAYDPTLLASTTLPEGAASRQHSTTGVEPELTTQHVGQGSPFALPHIPYPGEPGTSSRSRCG